MLPARELTSILETLHLLRSPNNAQRLFRAIAGAEAGDGTPESLEELQANIRNCRLGRGAETQQYQSMFGNACALPNLRLTKRLFWSD